MVAVISRDLILGRGMRSPLSTPRDWRRNRVDCAPANSAFRAEGDTSTTLNTDLKPQPVSLKRARAQIRHILDMESGRDDASATYALIATHQLAQSLKLQTLRPGRPMASRFLHGVLIQLRDDLQQLGVSLNDIPLPRIQTG